MCMALVKFFFIAVENLQFSWLLGRVGPCLNTSCGALYGVDFESYEK